VTKDGKELADISALRISIGSGESSGILVAEVDRMKLNDNGSHPLGSINCPVHGDPSRLLKK